jgi:predicted HicB family RNase H-like nuclease
MSPKKTATLNLRIDPILKEAARIAAMRDQRSVANMIEVLIRKHCEEVGIPIPDQQSLFDEEDDG